MKEKNSNVIYLEKDEYAPWFLVVNENEPAHPVTPLYFKDNKGSGYSKDSYDELKNYYKELQRNNEKIEIYYFHDKEEKDYTGKFLFGG